MNHFVLGHDLNALPENCVGKDFNDACRRMGGEGIVLLKNDGGLLPLAPGETVALFGRMQSHYIRSGTGSGGLVNVCYTVGIPEGLESAGLILDRKLASAYADWERERPFDTGTGWASEPWSQAEMPLDDALVQAAAAASRTAVVVIGRTAGEDRDNCADEGSYRLSKAEEAMLQTVTAHFPRVAVVLNVGNIMDMSWVERYRPAAVLYAWQGGQEGGNALADVLVGRVSPSGKLSDTIARGVADYPSSPHFGNPQKNYYEEDVYVGYRYFNTFAKEKVLYPFGFGLSYTLFDLADFQASTDKDAVTVRLTVTNTGRFPGKEVVQAYYSAPQGKLGRPARELGDYRKTRLLSPGETERITLRLSLESMAAYDDTGATGHPACFVLEQGIYQIRIGTDSLTDAYVYPLSLDGGRVVRQCTRAMSPVESFPRMRPVEKNGVYTLAYETVPAAPPKTAERPPHSPPADVPYTGDKGIRLADVKQGRRSMEEFIAQFTDEDLAGISVGEGMNSPKVTGGTGCAFGGVTPSLLRLGVPLACGTDGPSGIRMDSGAKATLIPNGTLLACSWNDELVQTLYTYEGIEMAAYHIDALLGPGVNIHRHPLNGRNFEYFSEDPLLTGRMAAAICRGIAAAGATATVKHFCANNQETNRHSCNSVVSERALREIYLKAFEMTVKAGDCRAVMTSYNPVNGCWSAGNYDLTTTILRDEWGFDGFVMSDWWAKIDRDSVIWGRKADTPPLNLAAMAVAQNDIYMVHENAADFGFSNLLSSLRSGRLKRGVLQRNAGNICRFLMNSRALDHLTENADPDSASPEALTAVTPIWAVSDARPKTEYIFSCGSSGVYFLAVQILSNGAELSQSTVIFYVNGEYAASFTICGAQGNTTEALRKIRLEEGACRLTFRHPVGALYLTKISIYPLS